MREDTRMNVNHETRPLIQTSVFECDDTFKTIEPFLTNRESHESLGITNRERESLPTGFREYKSALVRMNANIDHLYKTLRHREWSVWWWDNWKIKKRLQEMPCYFIKWKRTPACIDEMFSSQVLNEMHQQKECKIIRGYDCQRDTFYFVAKATDPQIGYLVFVFNHNGEFQEFLRSEGRDLVLRINDSVHAYQAINWLRHLLLYAMDENTMAWLYALIILIGLSVPWLLGSPLTKQGEANPPCIILSLPTMPIFFMLSSSLGCKLC